MADDVVAMLKQATAGLYYPSETDAPLDVVQFKVKEGESIRDVVGRAGVKGEMECGSYKSFFDELEGAPDEQRFAELRRVMEKSLSDLTLLRVGKVKIDVYVVGKAADGAWAGVHTVSVET